MPRHARVKYNCQKLTTVLYPAPALHGPHPAAVADPHPRPGARAALGRVSVPPVPGVKHPGARGKIAPSFRVRQSVKRKYGTYLFTVKQYSPPYTSLSLLYTETDHTCHVKHGRVLRACGVSVSPPRRVELSRLGELDDETLGAAVIW